MEILIAKRLHPLLLWCLHILISMLLLLVSSQLSISGSTVRFLPGFPGRLPFHLETGYISVDEESKDAELFYYFVKSERNPKEDPLLLWLTGGPRCSSFSALAYEIGPLYFEDVVYNGSLPTLMWNRNSWTQIASIVFLDAPAGSGFSFSSTSSGFQVSDTTNAKHSYQFLRKWFHENQEYMSNPLYICGDSYSGKIIPIIVDELINDIEGGRKPIINFKGFLLGNPVTNRPVEQGSRVPFAHAMGFISDELYESMQENCSGGRYIHFDLNNGNCSEDLEAFNKCISGLNYNYILDPACPEGSPVWIPHRRSLVRARESFLVKSIPPPACKTYIYELSHHWANDNRVRKALHVKKGTVNQWIRCNYGLPYVYDVETSIEYQRNLSTKGYRYLIYSGDHDMIVTHISTEAWIRSLNLTIMDDWRPWFVNSQIAGFTRRYANGLTYATVKGAGHTAPEYRPEECFAMFKRWISHNPL